MFALPRGEFEPVQPPATVQVSLLDSAPAAAVSEPSPPVVMPPVKQKPAFTPIAKPVAELPPAPTPETISTTAPVAAVSTSSAPESSAPASSNDAQVEARFDADYLRNPQPVYPSMSRRLREEGKVMLRVYVLPDGNPQDIEIKRSSGSARLDEAAKAAVQRWRFVPARRGNAAVAAWVVVPIVFKLEF
jgi:protein TonB